MCLPIPLSDWTDCLLAALHRLHMYRRTRRHLDKRRGRSCCPENDRKRAQSKDTYAPASTAMHPRTSPLRPGSTRKETFGKLESDRLITSTSTKSVLHSRHHSRTNYLTQPHTVVQPHRFRKGHASGAPTIPVFKRNVSVICLPKYRQSTVIFGPMRKVIRIFTELCNMAVRLM
jgi:hypothetical protein